MHDYLPESNTNNITIMLNQRICVWDQIGMIQYKPLKPNHIKVNKDIHKT